MNRIDKLPPLNWTDTAREEIAISGASLVEQSDFAYQIGTFAVAGLVYTSYTSPPIFWFALAKGVGLRQLIDFRRLKEEIPVGAVTYIRADRPKAIRFAEFYGFEFTGFSVVVSDVTYNLFRRV